MQLGRARVPRPLLGRGQQGATVAVATTRAVDDEELHEVSRVIAEVPEHDRHRAARVGQTEHDAGVRPAAGEQLVGGQLLVGYRRRRRGRRGRRRGHAQSCTAERIDTCARLDPMRRAASAALVALALVALTACGGAKATPAMAEENFTPTDRASGLHGRPARCSGSPARRFVGRVRPLGEGRERAARDEVDFTIIGWSAR